VRVVLDTNVLVSGLLNPHGSPGRVVDLFLAGEITLLVDDRILAEYRAVPPRPKFGFDVSDVLDVLGQIEAESMRVMATPLGISLPDETDLPFLEVALAGEAQALVTGNARHFAKPKGASLAVESPAQFIRRWRDRSQPTSRRG
jgi:putative PIN family toxin of toxin-antitoxin system